MKYIRVAVLNSDTILQLQKNAPAVIANIITNPRYQILFGIKSIKYHISDNVMFVTSATDDIYIIPTAVEKYENILNCLCSNSDCVCLDDLIALPNEKFHLFDKITFYDFVNACIDYC